MHILISGSGGLLGVHLSRHLAAQGHTITALVRRDTARTNTVLWQPTEGKIGRLDHVDAVIHLAGESINGLWTKKKKRAIADSRVLGTSLLARTLAELAKPPAVLLCASAAGYYGHRGEEIVDEDSRNGDDFLAQVCRQWEEACRPAVERGIRVVHMRLAAVLAREGGMLHTILPVFRWGLGGRLGSGQQWMSWITLQDAVAAVTFLLQHSLHGPVNLCAPEPVRNAEFTRLLAGLLHRPALVRVPAWVLRLVLGELAEALLLSSSRLKPARLQAAGFQFKYATIQTALSSILY